jgi:hypothetical protein
MVLAFQHLLGFNPYYVPVWYDMSRKRHVSLSPTVPFAAVATDSIIITTVIINKQFNYYYYYYYYKIRGSAVGIAIAFGMDDRGVGVLERSRSRIFASPYRQDWLWGPLSLLSNGYREPFPSR